MLLVSAWMRSSLTSPRLLLQSGSCSWASMTGLGPRKTRLVTLTQRTARATAAQVRVRALIRKLRYLSIKTPIQQKERPHNNWLFSFLIYLFLQTILLTAKKRRKSQLSPKRLLQMANRLSRKMTRQVTATMRALRTNLQ